MGFRGSGVLGIPETEDSGPSQVDGRGALVEDGVKEASELHLRPYRFTGGGLVIWPFIFLLGPFFFIYVFSILFFFGGGFRV